MYKSILSILLVSFLSVSAVFAQFDPGDIGFKNADYNIYKNQKVQTQTQLFVDEIGGLYTKSISEFSEEGWLYRTTYAFQDPTADEENIDTLKDEYTYFGDGRIRIITQFGYDMYPVEIGFEYDKKNNLQMTRIASADAREYTYTYDKSGMPIRRLGKGAYFEVDKEGNSTGKMLFFDMEESVFTWDENGNLLSEIFTMRKEFYSKKIYTYNNKNQLTEQSIFNSLDADALPVNRTTFTYSDNGLLSNSTTEEDGYKVENIFSYTYYK